VSEQYLSLCMAQVNLLVGDIEGNTHRVLKEAEAALEQGHDVIVFPELTLTGYPPEDLLLRPSLDVRIQDALSQIQQKALPIFIVLGLPLREAGQLFNSVVVIHKGERVATYHKQQLPNFQVFDEKRYFSPGSDMVTFDLNGVKTALSVCEDIWHPGVMTQAKGQGAQLMLNLNASPFHIDKPLHREDVLKDRALEGGMPIVYVNLVGGQDELVFDGGSMVVDQTGSLVARSQTYMECTDGVSLAFDSNGG